MVYRVVLEFNETPLNKILETASSVGNFCYSKKSLFVESQEDANILRDTFFGLRVEEVPSHYDLSACSDMVRSWCNDIWRSEALKSFEDSDIGQERMKYVMAALNQIEEKRREGVVESVADSKDAGATHDSGTSREPLEGSV